MMGISKGDKDAHETEKPQHLAQLSRAFQLGRVPVTQELWQAVMGNKPSNIRDSGILPVESVSWFDCVRFCNAPRHLRDLSCTADEIAVFSASGWICG